MLMQPTYWPMSPEKFMAIQAFECGMRHPSGRKTDDDLSRLTSSSSSSSREPGGSRNYANDVQLDPAAAEFTSTYLPQMIDPIEWQQQSRKRKERQDSTSSITQDRKLIRSNSEEYIPSVGYEVVRRVSSHEDIKNSLDESLHSLLGTQDDEDDDDDYDEEDRPRVVDTLNGDDDDDDAHDAKSSNNEVQEILRETHRRAETSPARSRPFDFSQRYMPHRDESADRHCRGDKVDAEYDRRRSERLCMARAKQPARKSTASSKKSVNRQRRQQQSKRPSHEQRTAETSRLRESNDNHHYEQGTIDSMRFERRGFASRNASLKKQKENEPLGDVDDASTSASTSSSSSSSASSTSSSAGAAAQYGVTASRRSPKTKSAEEPRPWHSFHVDEAPVVSQRFAANTFDHVNNSLESLSKVRSAASFTKAENMKTCEIMKGLTMPSVFTSPDEKLREINKRLTALKKRVFKFEENYERDNGYRASHAAKLDDHYMKNAIAEINKLRKEKQALKTDPMATLGYKTSQTGGNKVAKMRDTLLEIERRLQAKRIEEHRSSILDELTPNQLVQEKAAVQRALLYLESLFGRPNTREERDVARNLYDRYRIIKRLVNRSAAMSGASGSGASELPTILEHEALALVVSALAPQQLSDTEQNSLVTDSPSDTSTSLMSSADSTDNSTSINENVHTLSLDELNRCLDVARDEKKQLRRTIKEFEEIFEERNGRKMLKSDRSMIEQTYAMYKQKKAKLRLLDALVRKHLAVAKH